jgi:hypothetical protein
MNGSKVCREYAGLVGRLLSYPKYPGYALGTKEFTATSPLTWTQTGKYQETLSAFLQPGQGSLMAMRQYWEANSPARSRVETWVMT